MVDVNPAALSSRTYLGDGVYASHDGFQIKLDASDGVRTHDTIFLEPDTLQALIDYAQRRGMKLKVSSDGR